MRARILAALALVAPLFGMTAFFSDSFGFWDSQKWHANGTISAGGNLLTSADTVGGMAMSLMTPPTGTYEIVTKLRLAQTGGRFTILARATPDARYGSVTAGSFYGVDFSNVVMSGTNATADMKVIKRVGGVLTQVAQIPVGLRDGSWIRVLVRPGGPQGFMFSVTLNERHTYYGDGDAALTSVMPGLGVAGAPTGSGFERVDIYNYESVPPPGVSPTTVSSSVSSTAVDFQWKGVSDGDGSGTWLYNVYRNGQYLTSIRNATFTDSTLAASTTYQYWIVSQDYHLNGGPVTQVSVTTTPTGSIDPRRMGVKPNGAYWGAGGENVDLQSGNLNYTVPLLTAVGRGQTSVPLGLSYNSQNWRMDEASPVTPTVPAWKLGGDIGYGFGWRLQAGSVTPYYSDWFTIHHWVYTDGTGAQYRLDSAGSGLFVSKESIYVTYDSAAAKLWFNNGTFWYMGATSFGAEDDAGTYYPTLIQDSNGNQVKFAYQASVEAGWDNSSGRLTQITDAAPGPAIAYSFTYTNQGSGARPHLQKITRRDGWEAYHFDLAERTLVSPYTGPSELTMVLTGITSSQAGQSTALDYNGSGEMISATLPYGGKLEWEYADFKYASQKHYREVNNRYLTAKTGGARWQYAIVFPSQDVGRQLHSFRAVIDLTAQAIKTWWMDINATSATAGLVYAFQEQRINWSVVSQKDYGWGLNNGNPYVAWANTTRDGVTTRVEQSLDGYGNQTQQKLFNTDLNPANARVYNYSYLTGGYYTDRYIRNRMTSATFTAGGQAYPLATNVYDNNSYPGTWLQDTWASDPYGARQHDVAYDANFTFRGDVTSAWTMSSQATTTMKYDLGGNVIETSGGGGPQVNTTLTAGTNYLLPSTVTPNNQTNLATSAQWDSMLRLTSVTGPNGATVTVGSYDAASRPDSTTSPTGAVTSYTYSNSAPQVTATVNGRWTKTTYDGLGRTIKVEAGTGDTAVSIVETEYAPCACTPLGKVSKVTMPHGPAVEAQAWTVYLYDALGRTLAVQQMRKPVAGETQDVMTGQTTYAYTGNTVTVTDPGGKWKTMTMDGFGNLVTVVEPNPANPLTQTWTTSYVYNVFNQLTTVTMPRPTGTQTRTFVYNALGQMTSVTQPETGTTTFGYDASGRPTWKRDAKQQLTEFSYDAYNRTTQILRYKRVAGADVLDPAQKTVYSYDSAVNGWGRLGSISTYQHFGDLTGATPIVESFEYTVAGLVSKKTLNVTGTSAVSVSYEWDNEGRPVAQKFPDMATGQSTDDNGPRFTWGYDSMGRLSTMGQTVPLSGWAATLVSSTSYNAAGQMTQLVRPGGTENRTYNVLGQLTEQNGLGKNVQYFYNATANDGRITQRRDVLSGEEVTYQYDALGRLSAAATTGPDWGLSFSYDGFGNKTQQTVTKGTGPSHSYAVDPLTNRLGGFGWDANGNVISGLAGLAGTYTYDVENRMVNNGVETYGYGAGNRRLWKKSTVSGSWAEVYLYGLGGEVLEVFRGMMGSPLERMSYAPTQRAWFGGRLIEKKGTALNSDRLGTYEKSFPYGELATAPAGSGEKFATYWRDAGTGLDYAVNRYYSAQMGRFLSADPSIPGDMENPQSYNLYSYVLGDPINNNDPEGLDVEDINVIKGNRPTCLSQRFMTAISSDVNRWLDSDVGTMALQVYFEWQDADTVQARDMWNSLANVYRNRWRLSNIDKFRYGFTTNGFKQLIYQSAGPTWNQPTIRKNGKSIANPQYKQSHWEPNGNLKTTDRNQLLRILNSSPDDPLCTGLIASFAETTRVYNDRSSDPTDGALFYIHTVASATTGDDYVINPFHLSQNPVLTHSIGPIRSYGGVIRKAFFYRPAQ